MPDLAAPILVPSSLANLRWILDDLIGAPSEFLLASVWSFARFDPRWPPLPEFDLPVAWSRVTERVAAFAGVEAAQRSIPILPRLPTRASISVSPSCLRSTATICRTVPRIAECTALALSWPSELIARPVPSR